MLDHKSDCFSLFTGKQGLAKGRSPPLPVVSAVSICSIKFTFLLALLQWTSIVTLLFTRCCCTPVGNMSDWQSCTVSGRISYGFVCQPIRLLWMPPCIVCLWVCACHWGFITNPQMVFSRWCISCWHLDKCLPSRADLPFRLDQERTRQTAPTLAQRALCYAAYTRVLVWCVTHFELNLCTSERTLPEADNGTLLADVTLGLVFGRLRRRHSVQDRQPDHWLGLQAHPIHKLPGFQLHLIVHLSTKEPMPTVRSLSIMLCYHVNLHQFQ